MDKNQIIEYNFIGAGWSFMPGRGLGVNGEGGIALMESDRDIMKSIFLILSTAPGERVMRTEFGCGIHDLVFDVPGPALFGRVMYEVQQALGRWEPRINVNEVRVSVDALEPERLLIDINYTVRQTNNERNLVYPFYNIPRGLD